MTKENVSVEISMPLIDDIELQSIDIFYNDIVSEYTKAFVKEKDQVIAQRLMMNLQQENQSLKKQIQERPKEYVFIGNAQNKTRDFINQITKDNKENKKYKEVIDKIEKYIEKETRIYGLSMSIELGTHFDNILGILKEVE